MTILVTYATKYGATREIAERVGTRLEARGMPVDVRSMSRNPDLSGYDAFIIGSAVYYGSWRKEAAEFVRSHRPALDGKPVWLFSSGPISSASTDDEGNDLIEAAEPKQIAEFRVTLDLRGHRTFYEKLDRGKLKFVDRLVARMPAFPGEEGDFRDWESIEGWAREIANELAQVPTA